MTDFTTIAESYIATWNEPSGESRRALLARGWRGTRATPTR